jgi:Fur family peroxide stress response transcriptional regulator
MITVEEARQKLIEKGLKITPQRLAVYEAIISMNNHPTAEYIIDYIRGKHPNIAIGTVYNVLETLEKNRLITKVQTSSGTMRYDADMEPHHHLFSTESDEIGDYYDTDFDRIIRDYFSRKNIKGFTPSEIRLHILGKFNSKQLIKI